MKRRAGELAKLDAAVGEMFVENMRWQATRFNEPGRPLLSHLDPDFRKWIDSELMELIARNPDKALARRAAMEVRRREAWQTPAKWALFLSGISVLISAAAFVVALTN